MLAQLVLCVRTVSLCVPSAIRYRLAVMTACQRHNGCRREMENEEDGGRLNEEDIICSI